MNTGRRSGRSWSIEGNPRAVSTVVATGIIVVILAIVGVGSYALLGGFTKGNPTRCAPITAPACGQNTNLHDLSILFPFQSIQQGANVPFTTNVPPGETAVSYSFAWGDHSFLNHSSVPTVHHNYSSPGIYLVETTAQVNGQVHDNLGSLQQIAVSPSFTASNAVNVPNVAGSILSNTTSGVGARSPTAVLQPGQSVTVTGSYTSNPSNPLYLPNPPSFQISGGLGGSISSNSSTAASATVKAIFNAAGTYDLTYVGSATSHAGNSTTTVFENFTFTVFVAAPGTHAGIAAHAIVHSPHPGIILAYELAPGGAASEDPAIDYETVGAEPIYNVYQSLITYNGSKTGPDPVDFVPQLATCVPGSTECAGLYGGDTLHDGWNYTFVINGNSSFYDPATGGHWGVYPTDVLFSYARTLGFSTLPCVACNPGWIQAQALLNGGNGNWSTIHAAYNNTPNNILGSMLINDTTNNHCPAKAMQSDHGCITFVAHGNHHDWPYFLELVADALGGAVVPCGWFSALGQGAGIPYWTAGNVSGSGDHPCPVPGSGGYGLPAASIPFTGWDHWEQLGSGAFGTFQGHVQFNMVGSGPYYMFQYQQASSYQLKANPNYGSNPYCTWAGCQPSAGTYAPNVDVVWETTATPGEQAYVSGTGDLATIPSTDISLMIQLIGQGKLVAVTTPTLTIGFHPFNFNVNIGRASTYTTSPITIHNDFFSYLGMRQFFIHAYPYSTVQNTINTRAGIELGFEYGGAIPQYMANYYPTNIPWPTSDPCTTVTDPNCASYWWSQMQSPASQYYDPEAVQCTANNPCELPLFGITGNPDGDTVRALWANQISSLSNGAVKVTPTDITFVTLLQATAAAPGLNPLPIYSLGWAPDYPDPTDYVVPLYYPNGTYTYGNAVTQSLLIPTFTSGCSGHGISDYQYYANNTFPQACQGIAYKAMISALQLAGNTAAGPYRALLYDLAEKIAYQLGLYTYTTQGNDIPTAAAWIDPNSINVNVTIGGGGDSVFYTLTGNSLQFPGST